MKKSNFFVALASFLFVFFFAYGAMKGKRVTVEEFQKNRGNTLLELESTTYNYTTEVFSEPFHTIIIKNNSTLSGQATGEKPIRWIHSDKPGIKIPMFQEFVESYNIEQGVLTLMVKSDFYGTLKAPIVFYGPMLQTISVNRVGGIRLIDSKVEALFVSADSATFVIEPSNEIETLKADIRNHANLKVELADLGRGNYNLTDSSRVENLTQKCDTLVVEGDGDSHLRLAPPTNSRNSQYHFLKFNDQIGEVIIETSQIDHIAGDQSRMKLFMGINDFKKLIKNTTP